MKTIFTLEDIRNFLLEKGYPVWNYEVYDSKTGEKRKATIEDFNFQDKTYSMVELAIKNVNVEDCGLFVKITDYNFVTYKDESDVIEVASTMCIDKDFSNNWISFLVYTHEEKYAKQLLKYAGMNKQRIKREAEEKIEKFKWKVQAEVKRSYTHYKDMEDKAKMVLTVGDIVEVEEEIKNEV